MEFSYIKMLNFLNVFSWIEKIGFFLFVLFLYSNIMGFIRYRKTMFDLDRGKMSSHLELFPVHNASPDAYLNSKNKVESFENLAFTERKTELKLSQDDINNLYTKGITLNKYTPGRYLNLVHLENWSF